MSVSDTQQIERVALPGVNEPFSVDPEGMAYGAAQVTGDALGGLATLTLTGEVGFIYRPFAYSITATGIWEEVRMHWRSPWLNAQVPGQVIADMITIPESRTWSGQRGIFPRDATPPVILQAIWPSRPLIVDMVIFEADTVTDGAVYTLGVWFAWWKLSAINKPGFMTAALFGFAQPRPEIPSV